MDNHKKIYLVVENNLKNKLPVKYFSTYEEADEFLKQENIKYSEKIKMSSNTSEYLTIQKDILTVIALNEDNSNLFQ